MLLEILAKSLETICEGVPLNETTVSRPANNNDFLQRNLI